MAPRKRSAVQTVADTGEPHTDTTEDEVARGEEGRGREGAIARGVVRPTPRRGRVSLAGAEAPQVAVGTTSRSMALRAHGGSWMRGTR